MPLRIVHIFSPVVPESQPNVRSVQMCFIGSGFFSGGFLVPAPPRPDKKGALLIGEGARTPSDDCLGAL